MSWLRLDDSYDTHPKLAELTELECWRWTRVLLSCARHNTGGRVTLATLRHLRITAPAIAKLVNVGLLETAEDGTYHVHDYAIYNGASIEEKVSAYLATRPEASSNEVFRAIGGNRGVVLAAIAQHKATSHHAGTNPGTESVPSSGTEEPTKRFPPARALPSPSPTSTAANAAALGAAAAATLAQAGWTAAQIAHVQTDGDAARALGLLAEAQADPSASKPAALAWSKFLAGATPAEDRATTAKGATGTRSARRLLPHGPCAVDGCDHRAASAAELDEHRRNVHGAGQPEPAAPPADLLRLVGRKRPPTAEPPVDLDDLDTGTAAGGDLNR